MPLRFKIAAVQMDVQFADPGSNLRRMEQSVKETTGQGAHLTVFPECSLAGYCFDSLEEARLVSEPVPGPATSRMAAACVPTKCHVVFGMLEADRGRLFNTCVMVGKDGVVGSYRKVHLPFLGVDRFTSPGDRPFAVQELPQARIGMNICYDASFPEAARSLALAGADVIVLPTNWPPGAIGTAIHVIHTRALENHVYYVAVNRVGNERGFDFIGRSKICSPDGLAIAEASDSSEVILYAEIDPLAARQKRLVHLAGKYEIDRFGDRRPELYGRLTEPVRQHLPGAIRHDR